MTTPSHNETNFSDIISNVKQSTSQKFNRVLDAQTKQFCSQMTQSVSLIHTQLYNEPLIGMNQCVRNVKKTVGENGVWKDLLGSFSREKWAKQKLERANEEKRRQEMLLNAQATDGKHVTDIDPSEECNITSENSTKKNKSMSNDDEIIHDVPPKLTEIQHRSEEWILWNDLSHDIHVFTKELNGANRHLSHSIHKWLSFLNTMKNTLKSDESTTSNDKVEIESELERENTQKLSTIPDATKIKEEPKPVPEAIPSNATAISITDDLEEVKLTSNQLQLNVKNDKHLYEAVDKSNHDKPKLESSQHSKIAPVAQAIISQNLSNKEGIEGGVKSKMLEKHESKEDTIAENKEENIPQVDKVNVFKENPDISLVPSEIEVEGKTEHNPPIDNNEVQGFETSVDTQLDNPSSTEEGGENEGKNKEIPINPDTHTLPVELSKESRNNEESKIEESIVRNASPAPITQEKRKTKTTEKKEAKRTKKPKKKGDVKGLTPRKF